MNNAFGRGTTDRVHEEVAGDVFRHALVRVCQDRASRYSILRAPKPVDPARVGILNHWRGSQIATPVLAKMRHELIEALSYRFRGQAMTEGERPAGAASTPMSNAIERLRYAVRTLPGVLGRFSEAESELRPAPERWTKKEVIGHLIDSAANNH